MRLPNPDLRRLCASAAERRESRDETRDSKGWNGRRPWKGRRFCSASCSPTASRAAHVARACPAACRAYGAPCAVEKRGSHLRSCVARLPIPPASAVVTVVADPTSTEVAARSPGQSLAGLHRIFGLQRVRESTGFRGFPLVGKAGWTGTSPGWQAGRRQPRPAGSPAKLLQRQQS